MAEKMIKEVITPDLGMDHPVPIAEIFVEVGQSVKKEDPLLSLESEKAVMDLPSPYEGVVKEIMVKADQEISAGTLLMTIEVSEQGAEPAADEDSKDSGAETPKTEASKAPEAVAPAESAPAAEKKEALSPPVLSEENKAPEPVPAEGTSVGSGKTGKFHASPSVRLYARELGVDLSQVHGTGPKNRVKRDDVQAFVKKAVSGVAGSGRAGSSGLPPAAFVDPALFGAVSVQKLTGIQKITGSHLHASWVNIPHVTHFEKSDVTELEAWRKSLNSQKSGPGRGPGRGPGESPRKYTTLAFVVKALTQAIATFPQFNSVLSPEGDSLILREYFNVGIAVDTPRGLLVPVIKETNVKGIGEIADEIIELAGKGREGKLKSDDLKGASISISNLGGIGGTSFTPIINPPEVAILGLSRSVMEPVWNGKEFTPRLMLPMSLSYDHRVIDGALAARFAAYLSAVLSDLKTILL